MGGCACGWLCGWRVTLSRVPRVSTPHYSSGLLIEKNDAYTKVFSRAGLTLMWNREDSLMVGARTPGSTLRPPSGLVKAGGLVVGRGGTTQPAQGGDAQCRVVG